MPIWSSLYVNSYPVDTDYDTIPDAVDEDDDNDYWPDVIELDRGSDPLDADNTPFNRYFGVPTGFFYYGGFETDTKYDGEALELSLSGLMEVVTEEEGLGPGDTLNRVGGRLADPPAGRQRGARGASHPGARGAGGGMGYPQRPP